MADAPKPFTPPKDFYTTKADNFPDLSVYSTHMSRVLTPALYNKLKDKKTPNGFTLDMVIQTGLDNPQPESYSLGCAAGDEESYTVFADLFDPVVENRHFGYKKDRKHTMCLDSSKLVGGSFDEKFVMSSRIRTGRNVKGIPLASFVNRAQRRECEKVLVKALNTLTPNIKGAYYSLKDMTPAQEKKLVEDHLLYKKPTSPLATTTGIARDWPDSRGIWMADDKKFLVWVNEEDHARVISMQKGGDFKEVFERFCTGLNKVEAAMKSSGAGFQFSDHLGYLSTCPSNLGTALRASVHINVPKVAVHPQFKKILENLRFETRGLHGEDSDSGIGMYDISNLDRLGFTELELVQQVVNGVNLIIEMEKKLLAGGNIDDLVKKSETVNKK